MNPAYLKITVQDRYPSLGGQQAVSTPSGVLVEHLPTGLKAFCDQGRSQLKNKNIAMAMIECGLAEIGWEEPGTLPGLDLPAPDKKPVVARKRDPLFDALALSCGLKLEEITRSAGAVVATALKEIRAVSHSVTTTEIASRAANYRRLHPQWELTPSALAKHWASLGKPTATSGLYANAVRPD